MVEYRQTAGKGGERVKIRTEICDEEEIVIRCREKDERIEQLERAIKRLQENRNQREIVLYSSGSEYYIPFSDILYFESAGGKIYAHTARAVYSTDKKLFELEAELPIYFARAAKSTIVNIYLIISLHRELVGNGEIYFKDSEKVAYFSRGYYKALRDKIQEMRLGK